MIEALVVTGMCRRSDVFVVRAALGRLPFRKYDVGLGYLLLDYDTSVLPRTTVRRTLADVGLTIVRVCTVQRALDRNVDRTTQKNAN